MNDLSGWCWVLTVFFAGTTIASASSDHPSLCSAPRKEWSRIQDEDSDIPTMKEFESRVDSSMCPSLKYEISRGIERKIKSSRAQAHGDEAEDSSSARIKKNSSPMPNHELTPVGRDLPGVVGSGWPGGSGFQRETALIACSANSDIAAIDQGNINGLKFENIVLPPENHFLYDVSDLAHGVAYVYEHDMRSSSWTRQKIAAVKNGQAITLGSAGENADSSIRYLRRVQVDLASMAVRGELFFEYVVDRSMSVGLENSGARVDFGGLSKRSPRLWVEVDGRCAYQQEAPPSQLTPSPEFLVTARKIPVIPRRP
jgi:hypothetical protein